MELNIIWTRFAENKIEDIYKYYRKKAGYIIALNLVNGIIDSTIELSHTPNIGQKEELLKNRKQEFRYLVFKNYKIIYWSDFINNSIIIANVFDCRQDPEKIKDTQ
jgi:plasmid stabilization system protein ParE